MTTPLPIGSRVLVSHSDTDHWIRGTVHDSFIAHEGEEQELNVTRVIPDEQPTGERDRSGHWFDSETVLDLDGYIHCLDSEMTKIGQG